MSLQPLILPPRRFFHQLLKSEGWLTLLAAALILFLPSNLFLVLSSNLGYVNGIQVDYLLPKLYVSQLVAGALLAGALWHQWPFHLDNWRRHAWILGLLGVLSSLLIWHSLQSPFWLSSIWAWGSLGLNLGLLVMLLSRRFIWNRQVLLAALWLTVVLQACLASYQWFWQRSLFPYRISGETNLQALFGLARTTVATGQELVLPYGTTAHPNVLAGVVSGLCLAWWWLVGWRRGRGARGRQLASLVITLAAGWTIWLTQSWSAGLSLAAGLAALGSWPVLQHLKLGRWLAIAWSLLVVSSPWLLAAGAATITALDTSWERRLWLNTLAQQTVQARPWLGTGLNLFTPSLAQHLGSWPEGGRFLQPIHHGLWLWLAETGLIGLSWAGLLGYLLWQRRRLNSDAWWVLGCWSLPLLTLDHYLISLQTGQLLIVVLVWLFSSSRDVDK